MIIRNGEQISKISKWYWLLGSIDCDGRSTWKTRGTVTRQRPHSSIPSASADSDIPPDVTGISESRWWRCSAGLPASDTPACYKRTKALYHGAFSTEGAPRQNISVGQIPPSTSSPFPSSLPFLPASSSLPPRGLRVNSFYYQTRPVTWPDPYP